MDGLRKLVCSWLYKWINPSGGEAANKDIWMRFKKAAKSHQVDLERVRGHSGHRENERVDRLAGEELAAMVESVRYGSEFDIDELSLQHLRSISKE